MLMFVVADMCVYRMVKAAEACSDADLVGAMVRGDVQVQLTTNYHCYVQSPTSSAGAIQHALLACAVY
jgi:hypothetical protein